MACAQRTAFDVQRGGAAPPCRPSQAESGQAPGPSPCTNSPQHCSCPRSAACVLDFVAAADFAHSAARPVAVELADAARPEVGVAHQHAVLPALHGMVFAAEVQAGRRANVCMRGGRRNRLPRAAPCVSWSRCRGPQVNPRYRVSHCQYRINILHIEYVMRPKQTSFNRSASTPGGKLDDFQ